MTESLWYDWPTNYSNGTSSVNGPSDLFVKFPSFILNDMFGAGITIMIWLFAFTIGAMNGSRKAITFASFIAFMFSIFFVRLGAINMTITIALALLTALGVLGSKSEGGGL